ncbi:ankyrin repeat domain-containing protein [Candidatus Babeliales bacterium]|nr:ankyrin repeat domain-containing protein [Candidatus Babeliales bacterium]
MFKKIMLMSLVLCFGNNIYGAAHWQRRVPAPLSDLDQALLNVRSSSKSCVELATNLIAQGANPNLLLSRMKIMDLFFDGQQMDLLKFVFENGGNPTLPDAYGNTPLHFFALGIRSAEYLALALKYVDKYAGSVNLKNADGETPLHKAAGNLKKELVELLLKAGADKTLKTKAGKTAYDLACEKNLIGDEGGVRFVRVAMPSVGRDQDVYDWFKESRIEVLELLSGKKITEANYPATARAADDILH